MTLTLSCQFRKGGVCPESISPPKGQMTEGDFGGDCPSTVCPHLCACGYSLAFVLSVAVTETTCTISAPHGNSSWIS